MKLESLARNLRILWREDSIIADIHIRHMVARSGLVAAAAAIALFSLIMFDLAAYFALEDLWGRIWAAIALGMSISRLRLGSRSWRPARSPAAISNWHPKSTRPRLKP
jgi:hypothetical protein